MHVVIYGTGAIGGTLAVMLARAGHRVDAIARGRQLSVLAEKGLVLRTAEGSFEARFPTHADPSGIAFTPDTVILLCVKTQDTLGALERLRATGVTGQPIFCMQNGIANDDFALRLFPNVFAGVVAMPATFIEPGEVVDFFAPRLGVFDLGRVGAGDAAAAENLAAVLDGAGFAAFVHDDIVPWRYAKLLLNLTNAIDAALGDPEAVRRYADAARAEANRVLAAAGIVPADLDRAGRAALAQLVDIPGAERVGSSSAQSLARGAGSIETDYLNGEIVLMGRKLGIPTPVNTYFADLAQQMIRQGRPPGSVKLAEVEAALPAIA